MMTRKNMDATVRAPADRRSAVIVGGAMILLALGGLPFMWAGPVALRAAPWLLAAGVLLGVAGLVLLRTPAPPVPAEDAAPAPAGQQVAELQRARDVAEAANAAKTRYLVAVSHEIRSPLNAIYGYAQLLERGEAVAAGEAGGVIRRSAEHLTNLVEGLLEISRVESGVLTVRSDVIPLATLLDDVVDMFRMQADAKGLALRYETEGRMPRFVRTDEKRLRQILINLLSNAVKYTVEGHVALSVRYRSQVATIAISDSGIGIAPDDLDRIFEPFERGHAPEATLQPGIGLGLAITRVLAGILGGEIVATSTPGAGSCFTLRIFLPEPLEPPGDAAGRAAITGYRGDRRTVLLIDDDPAQIAVLDSLLKGLGFVVYAAGNGAQGLAMAEQCRPDLVLLDVQMPGLGGWAVASRLRATHGDAVRIVMVSANMHEFAAGGDGAADHDAFVSKPVDLDALLTVIGRQLRLSWQSEREGRAPPAEPPPLPREAGAALEQLRRHARAGHIRAVEAALADLEARFPDSAPTVATMRQHVRNFDLRSLLKMIHGDQPR